MIASGSVSGATARNTIQVNVPAAPVIPQFDNDLYEYNVSEGVVNGYTIDTLSTNIDTGKWNEGSSFTPPPPIISLLCDCTCSMCRVEYSVLEMVLLIIAICVFDAKPGE